MAFTDLCRWPGAPGRRGFTGPQGEEGEVGDIDHASLAAAFGEEEEVGRRRLTRGKAADMGIDVPQISNDNDALLAGRSAPGTGVPAASCDSLFRITPAYSATS